MPDDYPDDIFGFYVRMPLKSEKEHVYISDGGKWAIWWDGQSKWWSGPIGEMPRDSGSAYFEGSSLPSQLFTWRSADFVDNSDLYEVAPIFKLQCRPKTALGKFYLGQLKKYLNKLGTIALMICGLIRNMIELQNC